MNNGQQVPRNRFPIFLSRYFKKGGFLRSVATLSSGSAAGNVILLLATPIISRLYLPDAFGSFSVFLSVFTIGSVFATMNLHVALPLPTRDGTAANLLVGSFTILTLFTLFSVIAVQFLKLYANNWPIYESIAAYVDWLPIAFFGAGANVILYFWLLRRRNYKSLAIIKVGQSSSMAAGQIAIGLSSSSALGLIVGHLLSQLMGAVAFGVRVLNDDLRLIRQVSVTRIRRVLSCYRDFSLQYTPGILVSTLTMMLPPIILTVMFSVSAAGLYAFTTRAIRGGLALVVQSVTRVAYLHYVELQKANNYEKFLRFYLKLCSRLAFIGIIPFAVLFFLGEEIFSLVFGPEWGAAGLMAAYLVPGLYCFLVFDQSLNILVIMKKQYMKFVWEILRFAAMIVVFVVGYFLNLDVSTLVLWLSLSQAVAYLLVFALCTQVVLKARDEHSKRVGL